MSKQPAPSDEPLARPKRDRATGLLLLALCSVLLLAALLRFQGLAWGLPNASHWFSYHPDEALVLGAARRVNLFAGQWLPGFYNYGSLLIYVVSVTTQVLDAWAPLAAPYHEMARMTVVIRAWVAVCGVTTVYMTFLMARRIAGKRAGLWAAACMAVIPMHAVHSHFGTVDVPATLLVSIALYHALRWPEGRRAALWCGVFAGLAAGTKYNAGLVILAGWAAVWLTPDTDGPRRWRAIGVMILAAALCFVAATPGVLFDTPGFLRDFGYEAHHVQTGHGLVFVNTGPGWWYHLSHNLWFGLGAFLPVGALLCLGVLFARRKTRLQPASLRPWLVLIAFAAPYFALISLAAVRFQRYDMPLLPILALGAGVLFASMRARWALIPSAALLATLVLAQGDISTMSAPRGDILVDFRHYQEDPRDSVAAWFQKYVPPGASIGLSTPPWFYTPPFSVANAGPQSRPLYDETAGDRRYHLVTPDADGATAFSPWPEFIVLSDYEYGDALRLQGARVPERAADVRLVKIAPDSPPEAQTMATLWNNILQNYTTVGVWSPNLHAYGLRWSKRRLPPHDSFYSYPTIIVFHRNKK